VHAKRSTPLAARLLLGVALTLTLPGAARGALVASELQQALDDLVATPGGPPGAIAVV